MNKRGQTSVASLVIATLLTGCGGSDSVDALPQINLANSATVKEKRTITITATATDDKSISSYDWQQISGPAATLAQAKSAAVSVTAPAVDADSSAQLRLTVTDSAGQTAQSTITLNITNNKAPVIAVTSSSNSEKSVVQLKATVTDADGTVGSYAWTQTEGPSVQLTGATTATPSFTAPAIKADTLLKFSLQVTDDDNETNTAGGTVTVTQKFVNYTVSGSASNSAFANSDVVVRTAGTAYNAKANSQGQFDVVIKTDDDDPAPNFGQLKMTSPTVTGVEYAAFLRDFGTAKPVLTANRAPTSSEAEQNSKTLTISEASTALFALIQQANNGVVPTDLASLVLLEKSLDADELIEATAVARIIALGTLTLPQNTTLVQLLSNNTAYSEFVAAAEKGSPGIISRNIDALIGDPAVTPPLTTADIPSTYYQTYPAGERFLPYSSTAFRFNLDGTGSRHIVDSMKHAFDWRMSNGVLEITYRDNAQEFFVSINDPMVQTVGAATIQKFKDNGIFQVKVNMRETKNQWNRVMKGERVDTFRVKSETSYDILPIQVGNELIDPSVLVQSDTFNSLMKNSVSLASLTFTDAELAGTAFNIRHRYTVPKSIISLQFDHKPELQMDVLEFQAGGSGIGAVSRLDFTWRIDNVGKLLITFSNGEKAEVTKIDTAYGLYQNLTSNFDAQNKPLGEGAFWMVNRDTASFAGQQNINPDNFYWQAMINGWRKDCWIGNQYYLYCGDDFWTYFGWQFTNNVDAVEHTGVNQPLPTRTKINKTWRFGPDGNVIDINRNCIGCSERPRVWWPLKMEKVGSKRRFWLLESQYWASPATTVFPFRITVYDELPVDTPDRPTALEVDEPRLIIQPSSRQLSELAL
jgi:predicted secreted protein